MCKKSTRRYLEFDEDIAGIIEDVEMPMQALKDKTPPKRRPESPRKKSSKVTRSPDI